MKLSSNFSLYELCYSSTALKRNINNDPNPEIIRNLQLLVNNILQKLRDKLGPIRITSGYRSPALNKVLSGTARKSQHIEGKAADIIIVRDGKMDNKLIFDAVLDLDLDFDQMIWEFGGKWIHISYKETKLPYHNRREILEAYKDDNNKTKYKSYPTYKSL
tara:strand:- start:274 stop:756 length:483 start_codon:yes stop_codon:yes gene_type:complete